MADIAHKRRLGDRKEGRRLRTLAPFYQFTPFIMRTRNDSSNYIQDTIEVTEVNRFFREKRVEGYKEMGMLHLFIASYIRTISHYPALNRFVSGQRIYARNNIEIVMAVKRSLSINAPETTIKVVFEPTDTIFDVYRKMTEKIDDIKSNSGANNTERVASTLIKIPGPFLALFVGIMKLWDYFFTLPSVIHSASPFHGTMIITDMGSLGIPPIYHHLYNFGNLPVFLSFGARRTVVELDSGARPVKRKYIDYMAVMDERICDGFYYASALRQLRKYLTNPQLLEQPPQKVVRDIF